MLASELYTDERPSQLLLAQRGAAAIAAGIDFAVVAVALASPAPSAGDEGGGVSAGGTSNSALATDFASELVGGGGGGSDVAASAPATKRPRDDDGSASSRAAPAPPSATPFRGPAADSPLGKALLHVLPLAFRQGHALELHRMRGLCGLTLRERATLGGAVATQYGSGVLVARRAADGARVVRLSWATLYTRERVDERGFHGATADVMARALEAQAPWLQASRGAPRNRAEMRGFGRVELTTNLMRAASAGDEQRVRQLLAAGASPHCVNVERRTALHYASAGGDARAAAALLEADVAGASINATDSEGYTPIMLACRRGHDGVVRALLARGARQDVSLCIAADCGHTNIVELLCAAPGVAVDAKDSDGMTALHSAVGNGRILELLCATPGTPVDAQNKSGCTPLMLASWRGREGDVQALLARGARQELRDSDGRTALHYAVLFDDASVVKLLCAAPGAAAALALRDNKGHTPLASALATGQGACAAVLRAHGAPS